MIGSDLPLALQTANFVQALMLGAALGLVYSALAAVRGLARAGSGLTALCDGLFWLIALGAYFVFTVVCVGGRVRGYLVLGCAAGNLLFVLTLGGPVRRALTALLRLAGRCGAAAGRVIALPWRGCRRLAGRGRQKILEKFQKKASNS